MGIAHFETADSEEADLGHLKSRWTYLGDAAESVTIGLNRIQVEDGYWATPAHEHGGEEEIFYILGGEGILWLDGETAPISAGDCIAFPADRAAHTVGGVSGLDVLAFGMRCHTDVVSFPRAELSRVGARIVKSEPGAVDGYPAQWVYESKLGPPEVPEPLGARPPSVVRFADVEPRRTDRSRVGKATRDLGRAAGSVRTGLKYVEVAHGKDNAPLHCHSLEEEIFVVLDGSGVLVLGGEETEVVRGTVVARPAGTGLAHQFRAGGDGLTYVVYGTREPADLCYYPRSNKISFPGLGVIGRLELLDYWDGED